MKTEDKRQKIKETHATRLRGPVNGVCICTLLLTLALFAMTSTARAQEFMVGADVSSLPLVEDNGGLFYDDSVEGDLLEILQDHNYNWIRLKIWHTPDEPYNDLERVRQMGVRIKDLGLNFLLDFHYSDTWADPGSQTKPAAWQGIAFDALVDSMYNYTYAVMTTLRDSDAMPNMVQIGNEINCGLLWPEGNICGDNNTPAQWAQLGDLIGAAIQAVEDSEGEEDDVQIMIHHAVGHPGFLRGLLNEGLSIDYYGRSYYPTWHGDLNDLENNLTSLANEFDVGLVVAEVAYLWTTDWADNETNVFWTDDVIPGFPASVQGQTNLLLQVRSIVQNLPNEHGAGVFYWEPGWITTETRGTPWENACLFDFEGNALSSIDALPTDISQHPTSTITMRINTSTLLDTFRTNDILQIRGEVFGLTGGQTIDGRRISWGDDSRLLPESIGDEIWEIDIPLYVGDTLSYKFWSGFTLWDPTHQRLGWEGPVTPPESFDSNTRMVVAGENDTTITLQYLNGTGATVEQFWRPYEEYEDSLVIAYRVNMAHAIQQGIFDPNEGDEVVATGSAPLPETGLILQQEEFSVADGSFYSGAVRIPTASLTEDLDISFKYVIQRENGNRVNEDPNRGYTIPSDFPEQTLTIQWVFFNNGFELGVEGEENLRPATHLLMETYPNPFNASIRMRYNLLHAEHVTLSVHNMLGQQVRHMDLGPQQAGEHQWVWQGLDQQGTHTPSGVYFVTLRAGNESVSRKIVLLR